jgi:hypothetical protein
MRRLANGGQTLRGAALALLTAALLVAAGWLRHQHSPGPPAPRAATPAAPDSDPQRRQRLRRFQRAAPQPPPRLRHPASGPTPRKPAAVEAFTLRLAARQNEAAGDGRACLARLNRADVLTRDTATRWQYLRGLCELRAGRCDEGRKRLRRALLASPGGRNAAAIELQIQSLVDQRCPTRVGPPLAQTRRLLLSVPRERRLGHLEVCRDQGQRLRTLWEKLSETQRAPLRAAYHNATIEAAKCAGWLGRCAEAWAGWREAYHRRYAGSLPAAHVERLARLAFPRQVKPCQPPPPRKGRRTPSAGAAPHPPAGSGVDRGRP